MCNQSGVYVAISMAVGFVPIECSIVNYCYDNDQGRIRITVKARIELSQS